MPYIVIKHPASTTGGKWSKRPVFDNIEDARAHAVKIAGTPMNRGKPTELMICGLAEELTVTKN
jgi:hypothetical protein